MALDPGYRIQVHALGLELTEFDSECVDELFAQTSLARHRCADVVVMCWNDERLVGAITKHSWDELSVVVDEGHRRKGIATEMLRAFLFAGGTGSAVAATDDGVEFLHGLHQKLTPDERESLDVPSWKDLERRCAESPDATADAKSRFVSALLAVPESSRELAFMQVADWLFPDEKGPVPSEIDEHTKVLAIIGGVGPHDQP